MDRDIDGTVRLLKQLQKMVRRSDAWRGWVGWDDDAPDDDEVEARLQDAIECLRVSARWPGQVG